MPIGRMQLPRELRSSGGIMSIGDQGGMKNYLGNQPMVTAPKFWRSGPDSPPTELAYITDAEKNMIMKADLHGSLSQGPNEGPSGIMSLDSQGDYTRDRSPAGTAGRSRQGQAQHEQHMRGILTGQKNIGQTSAVSNRVRQGAVPEYAQGPDGRMKYIGSGSKFVGKSLFNPSGYRNIYNKRGGFFGLGGQKDIQLVGSPGRQYYSFTDPRTGDVKPGFGGRILGGLASLISGVPFVGGMIGSAIDKYKPKSYWDKLPDSEKRRLNALNITPYNQRKITAPNVPMDSLALQNFYNNPLTQTLMTKNYSPKPEISNLKERINISNQFQMPLDYSASDLQARARRAMTQPGMQIKLAPYEKGIPEDLQFWDGRPFTATPYDPYKEMYSTLPGNNLRAELTKMQKKGLDAKRGHVKSGLFSVEDAYESIKPFDDKENPATLQEVKEYYGIV